MQRAQPHNEKVRDVVSVHTRLTNLPVARPSTQVPSHAMPCHVNATSATSWPKELYTMLPRGSYHCTSCPQSPLRSAMLPATPPRPGLATGGQRTCGRCSSGPRSRRRRGGGRPHAAVPGGGRAASSAATAAAPTPTSRSSHSPAGRCCGCCGCCSRIRSFRQLPCATGGLPSGAAGSFARCRTRRAAALPSAACAGAAGPHDGLGPWRGEGACCRRCLCPPGFPRPHAHGR